jgi:hypothetical protein
MHHLLSRLALAAGLSLLLAGPLQAQDGVPKKDGIPKKKENLKQVMKQLLAKAEEEYRVFFKKPETTPEFWAAIKFEIQVGKFDVAALHLDQMLAKLSAKAAKLKEEGKSPEDAYGDLVAIEEVEGFSSFLRLKGVRQWTDSPGFQKQTEKNVEALLDRLTTALDKQLGDPERVKKFIDNLSAPTPEERAFAFAQLARARGRASPYLLQELKREPGSVKQQRLLEAMAKLEPDIMPPMLEALNARDAKDAADIELRVALLELIRRRAEKRAIPYLWHLSSSRKYPERVRNSAAATLAYLLETDPRHLPPAKHALTQMAEQLAEHKVKFKDPRRIRVWRWTENYTISPDPVELEARDYEEVFGLRYARQALELDPSYRPAQIIFLTLTLERAYDEKLDLLLTGKTLPALDQLLASIDATLLIEALDRALAEHNLAVALPLIKALGERGEVRAARPGSTGTPGPLVRALYYPDRRVQFAAAYALLRMPGEPSPAAAGRVVEVLRRFVAAAPTPRALVVFAPDLQAAELRKQVKAAGFDPVVARDLKEAFAALHQAADIDVILVHHKVPEVELPYVLAQLRADREGGLLPLLFVAPVKREGVYSRLEERNRNVWVLPEAFLRDPAELKTRLEEAVKLATAPDAVARASEQQKVWLREDLLKRKGQKLSDAERKQFATESLDALWKMARGQIKGYDVRAAEPAIVDALRNPDTATQAIEILTTFPGNQTQQRLADMVLDAKGGKRRVTAALALNQHVQKNGLDLTGNQLALLRQLYAAKGVDPNLRTQLAVLMGSMRTTAEQTGDRLYRFDPSRPAPK